MEEWNHQKDSISKYPSLPGDRGDWRQIKGGGGGGGGESVLTHIYTAIICRSTTFLTHRVGFQLSKQHG